MADGDLDHVIGILRLKDFVVNIGKGNFVIDDLMTKPLYFHENMNVYKVLEKMKSKKASRALICDEFGSCSGIITHKDILEALIGDIDDEIEDEPDIVERKSGEGWIVDGQCTMYDFLSHFDMDGPRIDKVIVKLSEVGNAILLFLLIGVVISVAAGVSAPYLYSLVQAPEEAFTRTDESLINETISAERNMQTGQFFFKILLIFP